MYIPYPYFHFICSSRAFILFLGFSLIRFSSSSQNNNENQLRYILIYFNVFIYTTARPVVYRQVTSSSRLPAGTA
jgi:hypothetical protein